MVVLYALLHPSGRLEWRTGDDRQMEADAGGPIPAAVDRVFLPHGGCRLLRLLASDIALLRPEDFPPNPVGGAVVTALGRPPQPWRGALVIYQLDDPESGWPVDVDPQHRALIEQVHQTVTATLEEG